MACEVCEHCSSPVRPGEGSIREGYSYHIRCKKCYVCSETNLHNAEVFKGVIFCSGCSRRIFRGCSTARRVKTGNKRSRGRKRRRHGDENRVIELARLNSLASDSKSESSKLSKQSSDVTSVLKESLVQTKGDNMKKASIDMATTTDVTQELLKRIYAPVHSNGNMFASPAKPRKKRITEKVTQNKKHIYSDLRIAELGASREIAHVALRRRSEVPVIIQSESGLSKHRSYTSEEPDSSDSDYSKGIVSKHWLDRRFRSLIKLPYRCFKKNILNRSSLVNTLSSDDQNECVINRIKAVFRHEITEHQRRGLKRLFSTINRRKKPYKLGWLQVMDKIPEISGLNTGQETTTNEIIRCKHFRKSHSYRCMRNQVMKAAGPTRSELAVFRSKMKNFIFFDFFRTLYNFNKQFLVIMTSQASKRESIAYTQQTN